jgi:uncharacterized membrane protein YphA (DoxX/SURF4 family)
VGLAAVWLTSGAVKRADAGQIYLAVKAYDVLPDGFLHPLATVLPLLEAAIVAFALIGLGTRIAAVVAAILFVLLIAAIAQS